MRRSHPWSHRSTETETKFTGKRLLSSPAQAGEIGREIASLFTSEGDHIQGLERGASSAIVGPAVRERRLVRLHQPARRSRSRAMQLRRVALPASPAHPLAMFSVTRAEATAIRGAFHQRGELSAVIELRRLFPGIIDNRQARECVRMIAGWGLTEPDQPRRSRRTSTL